MQNNFQSSKKDLQKGERREYYHYFREIKFKWSENYFWKSREKPHQILTELRCPTSWSQYLKYKAISVCLLLFVLSASPSVWMIALDCYKEEQDLSVCLFLHMALTF